MCGFTGVISSNEINNENTKESNQFSLCRGPDNQKNLTGSSGKYNYDLWFNRLSIIDLSEKANQPMESSISDSLIMFNGEIYNSQFLRSKIIGKKYKFITSHSDTETLLAGLEIFGIDFIKQIEGQFSIFYWNKRLNKIYLIKDRLGQKPLYFSISNNELLFASNKKSLLRMKKDLDINLNTIHQYIAYGVVFSPNTIYQNIRKVVPGSYIEVDYKLDKFQQKAITYWKPENYLDNKNFNQDEFIEIFKESVKKRLVSDVPIANFLSGGIDSTSIVKCLTEIDANVNTFSVIVDNKDINEKKYIDQVTQKYGTNHNEAFVNSSISDTSVREALLSMDEPYGDPSIVPSFELSKLISNQFKVAISGDGGDELLGGYLRMKNHLIKKNIFSNNLSKVYKFYPAVFGTGANLRSKSHDSDDSYLAYLEDEKFFNYLFEEPINSNIRINLHNLEDKYKSILQNEYSYYLSDQMMFKVDRASMANSLEVRSPLVDNKLIEYIFSHTTEYVGSNFQKLPLYKYLETDFDKSFLNRPKQGFVFDYKSWIFENFDLVIDHATNNQIENFIDIGKLKRLKIYKTRINSLRIWRVFVLANYLDSTSTL